MRIQIFPSKCLGEIVAPPSKSIAHRAIIAAAFAKGLSIIRNVQASKDILSTIQFIVGLGAKIQWAGNDLEIEGSPLTKSYLDRYDFADSASTMRFSIPIFGLLDQKITLTGSKRLMERPLDVYETLFASSGILFQRANNEIVMQGKLESGPYQIRGDVSSQFVTGLMFALSLLEKDSTIEVLEPFESRPYVALTMQVLKSFGVEIIETQKNHYFIRGSQTLIPQDYSVEGDYSQIAFFAALGALNAPIEIKGLNKESLQGDRAIIELLRMMNAHVEEQEQGYSIAPSTLKGITVDVRDTPDLAPILVVLGMFAEGRTRIEGINRLRLKESDRVYDLIQALYTCGLYAEESKGGITIIGPQEVSMLSVVNPMNDHRIFMALSILATISNHGLIIENPSCVSKSYPNFLEDLQMLGIKMKEIL